MSVQYAHNEGYTNDLNTDYYSAKITKMPVINGSTMTSKELLKHIRLNINSFINTKYADFQPYSSSIDGPVWRSDNPLGAVMKIDIMGPDNASVVCSFYSSDELGWGFTTIEAPATGEHPVSGNREFFISEKSGYNLFVIKGLDIGSSGIPGLGLPILEGIGYSIADKLWKSMRQKVMNFINSNGGSATVSHTYQKETEWRYVYWHYKKDLASVFGPGAGSA